MAWLFVSSTRRPKPTANWPTNNDDVLHEIKILKTSIWQKYIIFHTYTYPQNPNPEMSTCLSWKLQHLHSVSLDIKWTIQNGGAANKLLCCSRAACNHEKQNGWIMKLAKVLEFNFSNPHIPCIPREYFDFFRLAVFQAMVRSWTLLWRVVEFKPFKPFCKYLSFQRCGQGVPRWGNSHVAELFSLRHIAQASAKPTEPVESCLQVLCGRNARQEAVPHGTTMHHMPHHTAPGRTTRHHITWHVYSCGFFVWVVVRFVFFDLSLPNP